MIIKKEDELIYTLKTIFSKKTNTIISFLVARPALRLKKLQIRKKTNVVLHIFYDKIFAWEQMGQTLTFTPLDYDIYSKGLGRLYLKPDLLGGK